MMSELFKCKKCGGDWRRVTQNNPRRSLVKCQSCDACTFWQATEEKANEEWNNSNAPDEEPEIVACMHCKGSGYIVGQHDGTAFWLECDNKHCLCSGPLAPTIDEAVAAWNRQNEKRKVLNVNWGGSGRARKPSAEPTSAEYQWDTIRMMVRGSEWWMNRCSCADMFGYYFNTPKPLDDDDKCPRL